MQQTYWREIDHIVGPAHKSEFGHIGQQATRDHIEEFILSHSTPATRVLDVGCNTGVEGYRLFQKKFPGQYVGIDSNPKALVCALVNLNGYAASVALADATEVPFPDRSFGIVLSKDVIEHVECYAPILAELARVADSYLILSMFIKTHDEPDVIHREPQGYYHNRYNRQALLEFVTARGFESPRVIYTEPGVRPGQFQDEVLVFRRLRK